MQEYQGIKIILLELQMQPGFLTAMLMNSSSWREHIILAVKVYGHINIPVKPCMKNFLTSWIIQRKHAYRMVFLIVLWLLLNSSIPYTNNRYKVHSCQETSICISAALLWLISTLKLVQVSVTLKGESLTNCMCAYYITLAFYSYLLYLYT